MPADAMLLVMDMINDLVHPSGPDGAGNRYADELARLNTVENVQLVLEKARRAGVKVGYVRVGFSPDYRECPPRSPALSAARASGRLQLGTWGTEVYAPLAPEPGDFDVIKHRVSPFYGTNLEVILRAHGIRQLFLCGVATGGVVQSGTRDAHDRDYDVTVIENCCAAPGPRAA